MKKASGLFVCISILAVITGSCKIKDRNTETVADTSARKMSMAWLLAGDNYKAWAIESFTVNKVDQLKDLESCQLDNLDLYYRNLVFESVEGDTRCKTTDSDLRGRGKWTLNADSTGIEIKLGQQFHSLQIIELTQTRFHYKADNDGQITEAVFRSVDYRPETTISADTTHQ